MNAKYFFLLFVCGFVLQGCRTISIESSNHNRTDSIYTTVSHNTTNASVQVAHDTVRIHDSVRVVVDSIGNIIREYYSHNETNTIVREGRDTMIIVIKDSTVASSTNNETTSVVKKSKTRNYDRILMILPLALAALYLVVRQIKRILNER